MTCPCGLCATCRIERKRRHARDRKARQRKDEGYADVALPLFDLTERTDWIEHRLALLDAIRRRERCGSRC